MFTASSATVGTIVDGVRITGIRRITASNYQVTFNNGTASYFGPHEVLTPPTPYATMMA